MTTSFITGTPETNVLSTPYSPRWLSQTYVADLNHDGNDDLVVLGASYPSDGAPVAQPGLVAFGTGGGHFALATPSQFPVAALTTTHPREAVFADFNGDGYLDLFIADHGYDAPPFPGAQNRLFLSNGNGTWRDATANLPQISDFSHSASAADVDGDGDLDIVVGNVPTPNPVNPYVLVNNGVGTFTRADVLPTAPGQLLDPSNTRITSNLLVDLDGDGLPDLVAGSAFSTPQSPKPAQIAWNHGGSFAQNDLTALPAPAFIGAENATYDVQAMDVNADGKPDLVIAYQNSVSLGGWELQVLVNRGNHVFTDETTAYLPEESERHGPVPTAGDAQSQYWVQFIHPRDLNGDGRMDFVLDARGSTAAPASLPVAYIAQADGSFDAVQVSDFGTSNGWMFDFSTQYAKWAGGSGFVHVSNYGGNLHVDVLPVSFVQDGTAHYAGAHSAYAVSQANGVINVNNGSGGTDTLTNIERIAFADQGLAFDMQGHAGSVARIIGAVFGAQAVGRADYVAIGLSLADHGASEVDMMQLALGVRLGTAATNGAVVSLLYQNVVGVAPSATELASFTGLIDNGSFTQASLGVFAADTDINAARIGLAGLAASGLVYQLV